MFVRFNWECFNIPHLYSKSTELKKKIYRIRISEDRTGKYVFLKNFP